MAGDQKSVRLKQEKLRKICAKESGYKVEEVETFEHQALDLDSQVISLLGTVAKTVSGQADGILTRDYVMLTLSRNILIRYEDLKAAVLVEQTVKIGKGTKKAGVNYLIVGLLGKNGSSTVAECTKESGLALIRLLKEKNPDVYTADEEILDDNEYLDVWGKFNGRKPPKLEEE